MPKGTCAQCGVPMPDSLAPGPCGKCLEKPPAQLQTSSLFIYKGAVREALLAWKLQGDGTGLYWLLKASEQRLHQLFTANDLLIPVPMPLQRMRRSGLHHSADLCQHISSITGATTDWRILRRQGQHLRQSSLRGKARQINLRKAFGLANDYLSKLDAHHIQGKIWVIDDILTTGATLRHACQTMKRANQPVSAFSFARTLQDI